MGCNHDCASCSSDCSGKESLKEELNQLSTVKKVIGVVSGKGGVGKSLVTSLMVLTRISQVLQFPKHSEFMTRQWEPRRESFLP